MSDDSAKRWTPEEINGILNAITDSNKAAAQSSRNLSEALEEPAPEEKTVQFNRFADTKEIFDEPDMNYGAAEDTPGNTLKYSIGEILAGDEKEQKPVESKTVRFEGSLLPKKEHSMESDENRRRFFDEISFEEEDSSTASTKEVDLYEKPGFVVKRNTSKIRISDDELEEAPVLVESEDVEDDEDLFVDEKENDEEFQDWSEGQMRMPGFDYPEEMPAQVNEEQTEKDLRQKRKDKINTFKLKGIGEAEDMEKATDDDMAQLFGNPQKKKKQAKPRKSKSRLGFEYTDEKDTSRIRATLHQYKLFTLLRTAFCAAAAAALFALNIVSQVTAGYDSRVIGFINIVLLIAVVFSGRDSINKGVVLLFKKEPDMSSAVTAVMFAALVQSICVFVLDCILESHSFMISGPAAAAFAIYEYGEWLRHSRTYDAFNFCTGKNKDSLYGIQEFENKDDEFEIGRNLLMDAPDIRYSCRTRNPSRIIERCEKEVSSDKLQILLLPCSAAGALLCGIAGGLLSKDVMYAVTTAVSAFCICVPVWGSAAIQLPLYWANKRLNKTGGLITGQAAIDEYSRANSIVVDSADLFDKKGCCLYGLKDYKRVRVDDVMLYAAAMVVHSKGPLSSVFENVVSNKDMLPEVTSFKYEDRMGISGWINGQKVIMGNKNMMRHHNFDVESEDESKFAHDGRKIIYIAIANSLAAMLVVGYAPNKRLMSYIRRLGTDGVTVLLRNNDANVTTDMINETFGVRFNNIRIMSNNSARVYKKYRTRVKERAKTGILHDGETFSFMRSFTMSYSLCGTFKVENLIQLLNVVVGLLFSIILFVFKVIPITGMWPLLIFQAVMTVTAFIVARLRGLF